MSNLLPSYTLCDVCCTDNWIYPFEDAADDIVMLICKGCLMNGVTAIQKVEKFSKRPVSPPPAEEGQLCSRCGGKEPFHHKEGCGQLEEIQQVGYRLWG